MWQDDAACVWADPALFDAPHPNEGKTSIAERIEKAGTFCDRCPVQVECERDALAYGDEGFRAGVMRSHAPQRPNSSIKRIHPKHREMFGLGCGSHAAYRAHYRRGEKPCTACQSAENAYRRERDTRRKHDDPHAVDDCKSSVLT